MLVLTCITLSILIFLSFDIESDSKRAKMGINLQGKKNINKQLNNM